MRSIESFLALPLRALADAALARARALGAEHADFRFERVRSASWRLRDASPPGRRTPPTSATRCGSCTAAPGASRPGVDLTMDAAARVAAQAVAMAKLSAQVIAAAGLRRAGRAGRRAGARRRGPGSRRTRSTRSTCRTRRRRRCSPTGARGCWRRTGVDHVDASLLTVQENKFYADTAGTVTTQQRVRLHPQLTAVAVDEPPASSTRCARSRRRSGRGWEYLTGTGWDWDAELERIPELLAEKMRAPSVEAGRTTWSSTRPTCG